MTLDPLRVLIADDELVARKRLTRLLSAMDGVELVGEATTGLEALARVREGGVDVLLLDIQMPGLTGLEAAALLPEGRPLLILCTAHEEHAVHAFERGAVDYLVKPVEASRLHKGIERARQRLALSREAAAPTGPAPRRLAIETQGGLVLLDPGTVTHAVLDGQLVALFTLETSYLSTDPVGDLHARLGVSFERVHRRAIVNMDHVLRLEPTPIGGFVAHLRGGARVEVSRQSARELRRKLRVG